MSNQNIQAGIIGGAGYTGGELIRLLLNHPNVTIAFIHSNSQQGKKITDIHTDLLGDTDLTFTKEMTQDIDVLFLCVGHGEARKFLESARLPEKVRIIDLSQDFRLLDNSTFGNRKFHYGLPELQRETIRSAGNIANPGCFATCIQLGLLPLAKAGLLKDVSSTGITGSTGAGQGLSATSHFSWRINNIQAYKTLQHQHLKEILQSLHSLQPNGDAHLHFVPWRGDFSRGIYVSSHLPYAGTLEEAYAFFEVYYADHPFTVVSRNMVDLKQVVNTNKCMIHLELVEGRLAIHSAIDNLLKGASGQAVQNMNLMFGVEETTGLKLKATSF
jgi:N-acetyl-gamma-glutamyl-phosphate reductase